MASDTVDTDVEWSEPPTITRHKRTSKYQPKIDKLMERPGVWAKVMTNVNTASAKVFTNHGCEITTRSNGQGKVDVWAMYPGDAEDDDSAQDEGDEDEGEGETEVATRKPRKRPSRKS
jgi:hypothetical protein